MSLYYSATTNGFYDDIIHAKAQIPYDAVAITAEQHQSLLNSQSSGRVIQSDAMGRPVSTEPPPPTNGELSTIARRERDALITKTDYLLMPDYPIAVENKVLVEQYRQALRDIPLQSGFPTNILWPDFPTI